MKWINIYSDTFLKKKDVNSEIQSKIQTLIDEFDDMYNLEIDNYFTANEVGKIGISSRTAILLMCIKKLKELC